jgi:choline dehydrogenase-like flavoprotein
VIDNPNVGESLQDHMFVAASHEVKDGVMTTDMVRDDAVKQAAMQIYQETHAGPLAWAGCSA